jgi:hypothetical protein
MVKTMQSNISALKWKQGLQKITNQILSKKTM